MSGALAPLVLELENFYEKADIRGGIGLLAADRMFTACYGTTGNRTGGGGTGDRLCAPG